jgi:hypothetical protein
MASMGLQDIFEKRKVFLNNATKFNDPFECRPSLTVDESKLAIAEYLKKLIKDEFPNANRAEKNKLMRGGRPSLIDQVKLSKAYNGFIATVGIYSLSEKNDDLLMWAHYSNAHRGLCLEFDASTKDSLFWEAFRVVYQEDYPIVNMMRLDEAEEFRKALLTKSSHWSYEQEWRILKMETEGGPGYFKFAPELLTGVIFGALMSDKHKKILKQWVQDYPVKISIYQATLNRSRYQIDMTKVSEA